MSTTIISRSSSFEYLLGGRLEKPLPPVLVQATHHFIELQWEHIRTHDDKRSDNRRLFDEYGAARSGTLIYLHRREKRNDSLWENVYTYVIRSNSSSFDFSFIIRGSALSCKVDNLKPNTQYEFRVQYKTNINGGERSDWSANLVAETTSEPMSGETIFKAITMPGKDQLEKLLKTLYVLHIFFSDALPFNCSGPNHPLLEQPDKNGNLPLMHACTKLDIG